MAVEKTLLIQLSEVELEWLRWAVQDGHVRGTDERMIKERLGRRIDSTLGIKGKNEAASE